MLYRHSHFQFSDDKMGDPNPQLSPVTGVLTTAKDTAQSLRSGHCPPEAVSSQLEALGSTLLDTPSPGKSLTGGGMSCGPHHSQADQQQGERCETLFDPYAQTSASALTPSRKPSPSEPLPERRKGPYRPPSSPSLHPFHREGNRSPEGRAQEASWLLAQGPSRTTLNTHYTGHASS